MNKDRILIVDDDEEIRKQLKWALSSDYEVLEARDKVTALGLVRDKNPHLATLDISLDSSSNDSCGGMELLDEILSLNSRLKVIMLTGNDNRELSLKAIKAGAYDYYVKPINLEEIKVILKRALHIQKLELENERLARELEEKHKFSEIIGSSGKMREVFTLIKRVSDADAVILITGESGTGKELAARAIHYSGPRRDKPFGVINCAAIPENLLESELFGHEKGSFTDAYAKKTGKFELADKGTIFLDEIGDLSLSLQVKILRFLQERVIERVGGTERIGLDVRIISATNSDLKRKIQQGSFREDLYYRLSVISLYLPPLRERNGDAILLADYFLNKFTVENSRQAKQFNPSALKAIETYSWPGNVRELENKVKRAIILSNNSLISADDLGLGTVKNAPFLSLKVAKAELETRLIQEALTKSKGNISSAARELGISRVALYEMVKRYGIKAEVSVDKAGSKKV